MKLVTALHTDGGKFIVDPAEIGNNKSALVEMRDRDGSRLGNKVAVRDIVAVYYGELHKDAFPNPK